MKSSATGADQPKRPSAEQTLRSSIFGVSRDFSVCWRLADQRGGTDETGVATQLGGDHTQTGEEVEARVGA